MEQQLSHECCNRGAGVDTLGLICNTIQSRSTNPILLSRITPDPAFFAEDGDSTDSA